MPAYDGHLHNNAIELAAEFGIPIVLAAFLFVVNLFHDLRSALGATATKEEEFAVRTGLLALIGYLVAGLFEYTYGHSLGLILLSFAALSPLLPYISKMALSMDSTESGLSIHEGS